MTSISATMTRD